MKPLAIIVAMTRTGVIGYQGKIPWRLAGDMKHFKETTMGHAIIMGRKTYDSIGKPLPGRKNIVVTRSVERPTYVEANGDIGRSLVPTFEQALSIAYAVDPEPFVIGGADVYREALPLATKIVVTWVTQECRGDRWFPMLAFGPEWEQAPAPWPSFVGQGFEVCTYSKR